MTFLWFLAYLLASTPSFDASFQHPDAWFLCLVLCVALDLGDSGFHLNRNNKS